ncbi:MAG: D-alanyl-D-alanine carboxypeptidase family protein [Acidimicrobiales bacterium]
MTSTVAAPVGSGVATWPQARPKSSASRARRRRMFWRRRLTVLAGLAVAVSGTGWLIAQPGSRALGAASAKTLRQLHVEVPALVPLVPAETRFPGTLAPLPIPSVGQSAVFVRGVGLLGASSYEPSVPIASVTKVMTAVIVLRDHPLGDGSGPVFTMTAADHEAWIQSVANGDSSLEVVAGEHLTERQLLEALMIPSACNIADYLARWDAGSIPAFVRKMNAMAAALGLKHTHYADASGVDPASRSTAIDQAILGAYAMGVPGMISIEDHPDMTFPVEGAAPNYNPVVGYDGVIGLKSGFTDAAQICLVIAARRKVGDRIVLVVASTLAQPTSLQGAGEVDLQLLDAATSDLEPRQILAARQPVASVVAGWSLKRLSALVEAPVTVAGWPGLSVSTLIKPAVPLRPGVGRGWAPATTVAKVEVSTAGGIQAVAPAKLSGFLPSAPPGWSPAAAASSTTVLGNS